VDLLPFTIRRAVKGNTGDLYKTAKKNLAARQDDKNTQKMCIYN